jgi:hypothetical protein
VYDLACGIDVPRLFGGDGFEHAAPNRSRKSGKRSKASCSHARVNKVQKDKIDHGIVPTDTRSTREGRNFHSEVNAWKFEAHTRYARYGYARWSYTLSLCTLSPSSALPAQTPPLLPSRSNDRLDSSTLGLAWHYAVMGMMIQY